MEEPPMNDPDEPEELDAILENLADRLGDSASAAAVFGQAVEREGVTVIPVARVRWGVGGGGGGRARRHGGGAGGGVIASPVGYIELRDGAAHYRPILDAKLVGSALSALVALFFLVRRLRR
jgi:uncharacterized spore protein YtfJ